MKTMLLALLFISSSAFAVPLNDIITIHTWTAHKQFQGRIVRTDSLGSAIILEFQAFDVLTWKGNPITAPQSNDATSIIVRKDGEGIIFASAGCHRISYFYEPFASNSEYFCPVLFSSRGQ